jgi:Protein of unknown function (DUF2480)
MALSMENKIVNRVATSLLVTFDLEEFHVAGERVVLDIKDLLFQGMVLKEKDFREFIRTHEWSFYRNKFVAITCSVDAIVPTWAFMLLSVALQPFAKRVVFGDLNMLEFQLFSEALSTVNWESYRGAKVVIKGCSKVNVPVAAYVEVTNRLRPVSASIMYGEPCSTVPLFKRPRE